MSAIVSSTSPSSDGAASFDLFSFRPTASLKARVRASNSSDAGTPGANHAALEGQRSEAATPTARGYFKSLSNRKTYSIAELLQLRTKYVICPANLPDLSCVETGADDTLTWGLKSASLASPAASASIATSSSVKRPQVKGSRLHRSSEQAEQLSSPSASSSLEVVAPLPQSENRWKPQQASGFESSLKKLTGILNKLTVDKFDSLSVQFVNVVSSCCVTSSELRQAVQLVFDKALAEMNFGDMYPNLVVLLSQKLPAIPDTDAKGDQKPVTFKEIMLKMCQSEFEKAFTAAIASASSASMSDVQVEELRVKMRMRLLGNMKFIGELFNKHLLAAKIIILCSKQLLTAGRSDHIEAATTLLEVTGKQLEKSEQVSLVDDLFNLMKSMISSGEQLDSRTRFLLREIIELRADNYVPRRKKTEAKKIEEFRGKDESTRSALRSIVDTSMSPSISMQKPPMVNSTGGRVTPRHADRYSRAASVVAPVNVVLTDLDLAKRYDPKVPKTLSAGGQTPAAAASATTPVAATASEFKTIDSATIEKRTRSTVNEFLGLGDIKEAIECFNEIEQADNSARNACITLAALSEGMEAYETKQVANASKLLVQLVERSVITVEEVETGLTQTLDMLADIIIDLPVAPKRLSEMLAAMIAGRCVSQEYVKWGESNPSEIIQNVFKLASRS